MVSDVRDCELDGIAQTIASSQRIGGPVEPAAALDRLAASDGPRTAPRTLDLIGHSTVGTSQLRLGDWVIDSARPTVMGFFRGLADCGVLPRLGIDALRLLGCTTAGTAEGRATLLALSDTLRVEVWGTKQLLYDVHYDCNGFRDIWEFMLVSAGELRAVLSRRSC